MGETKDEDLSRRELLAAGSIAAASLCGLSFAAEARSAPALGKRAFPDRIAFDVWINDLRSEPHVPHVPWPDPVLDDEAVEDIVRALDRQRAAGYNMIDIFGLLAPGGWPADLERAVDAGRGRRARTIIQAAHDRGIKVLYGLGVYTWEFGEIIKEIPAVRGTNQYAMCASKRAAWEWQRKEIDLVLEYGFDGFHLESADLGRCECEDCKKAWPNPVAYHKHINTLTADYIRSRLPKAYLSVTLLNWVSWGKDFTDEEKELLVEMSEKVDSLVDQGHRQTYTPREKRRPLIEKLRCHYGTSGGVWTYAPPRWNRLRWFLPYAIRTGTHIKELYEDGGRAVMYYQSPLINPGVEVNVVFGGRMMCDVDRSVADVLAEVLEELYEPKTSSAREKLVEIFQRAEQVYFENWSQRTKEDPMRPGEIYLEPLSGDLPGASTYLIATMDQGGREAYRHGLLSILRDLSSIEKDLRDGGRVQRIKKCIENAIIDEQNLRM
ncbi:MAG: hypothetical protein HY721_29525 [Planctomycetes bacterium]|nr:hypothetical protein [Planctomycetota bacterium]